MPELDTVIRASAAVLVLMAVVDACVSDLRERRIDDRDWLALVAAFVLLGVAAGFGLPALATHVGAGVLVFAVGAALFALGVWGGGDVKLAAAVALLAGFGDLPRFLMVTALAGGMVALAMLTLRGARAGGSVPYGLAIAAGTMDWLGHALLPQL